MLISASALQLSHPPDAKLLFASSGLRGLRHSLGGSWPLVAFTANRTTAAFLASVAVSRLDAPLEVETKAKPRN